MENKNTDYSVSIIMPTYKRGTELVERAVLSVLSQTYEDIELILVDDNAAEELAAYRREIEGMVAALSSDKIVYIQNENNLGGAGSRNEGVKIAKGEYITFLDDDDMYLPQKIEKQLEFMVDNRLEMSFSKLNLYNEEDKLIDVREHNVEDFNNDNLLKYHLTKQITGTPTFMMKKYVFEKVGGFEIVPMGQEYYLMSKIILGGFKIGYFPECYIKAYRTKAEAISTGRHKISGEKALFKYKKKHFGVLSFSEKQYVRCRHYAVMAVAYKRNKRYVSALFNLAISVLCSPVDAVREAFALKKRIKEVNKSNESV